MKKGQHIKFLHQPKNLYVVSEVSKKEIDLLCDGIHIYIDLRYPIPAYEVVNDLP